MKVDKTLCISRKYLRVPTMYYCAASMYEILRCCHSIVNVRQTSLKTCSLVKVFFLTSRRLASGVCLYQTTYSLGYDSIEVLFNSVKEFENFIIRPGNYIFPVLVWTANKDYWGSHDFLMGPLLEAAKEVGSSKLMYPSVSCQVQAVCWLPGSRSDRRSQFQSRSDFIVDIWPESILKRPLKNVTGAKLTLSDV